MARVLQLNNILYPDMLGCEIARKWYTWDAYRAGKKSEWRELYKYIYATDTRTTSNQYNDWKNSTTTPKLTQIRDNLYANYMASMFPKMRWLIWQGADQSQQTKAKTTAIRAYMQYVIDYPGFKDAISRLVLDYIDYGNCIAGVDWLDERIERPDKVAVGYVGPVVRRYSPFDVVMDPTAPDFTRSPKVFRSLVSLGEVKEILDRVSINEGEKKVAEDLFKYLNDVRMRVSTFQGDLSVQDEFYSVDGFTSFRAYLESGFAEVLTFMGDLFDRESGTFLKNQIIQVVDRHKVIRNEPNPSDAGLPPAYHCGWRLRQDNLWAMGPLDNLVGLQYRIDHIENMKADFFDLVTFPPLKVKGYVEEFDWKPFEKIYVGDEGDVEVLASPINPLTANSEIERIMNTMEQLAGSPKEAMGFRTPGEKTAYEVQQLENAASRIFQAKITQFEEQILEPLLNAMLELARRMMDTTTVKILDNELNVESFMSVTADDIMGAGRIRPVAARHFTEVADRIQNVTNFFGSALGQDPLVRAHISTVNLATMMAELLDLGEYNLVQPYVRITEEAEAQQMSQQHQEDTMMAAQTPSGMGTDWDQEGMPNLAQLAQPPQGQKGIPNG